MESALALFFGKVTVVLLVLGGIALLALSRLRRRLRVSPHVASGAPLHWLFSPTTPGRLHRRLQGSVRAARSATGARQRLLGRSRAPDTASTRLAASLEQEAIAIDRRLVPITTLSPLARHAELAALRVEVDRLDDLARRIVALAHDEQQRPAFIAGSSAIDDLTGRVERLESARGELRVVETEGRLAVPPELSA